MSDLTVIIITFNEERNIREALESVVGWARQIYVVDSFSQDKTQDVAREYASGGVEVVQHRFDYHAAQLNWAIDALPIDTEWTLRLDADERVTREFREEADYLFRSVDVSVEGLLFRRTRIFLGRHLKWGEHRNNYDLRLWKTGCGEFEDRMRNAHCIVMGSCVRMQAFVLHEDWGGLSGWIHDHNQYSSLNARTRIVGKRELQAIRDRRKRWMLRAYQAVPWRFGAACASFLYNYVWQGGILDGVDGWRYALLKSMYRYWSDLKCIEFERTGRMPIADWGGGAIRKRGQGMAERSEGGTGGLSDAGGRREGREVSAGA